jgi:hypothetical protein
MQRAKEGAEKCVAEIAKNPGLKRVLKKSNETRKDSLSG